MKEVQHARIRKEIGRGVHSHCSLTGKNSRKEIDYAAVGEP